MLTLEEEKELMENYSKVTEDNEKLKKELEEKEIAIENEKSKFQTERLKLDSSIKDLQKQVFKLTSECHNHEHEKSQLERVVSLDSQSKSLLVNELEHFQQSIRNLEEMKEKSENKLNYHIKQLNEELNEQDRVNNQLKEQKNCLEKDLNELKVSLNRKVKEVQDKNKNDMIIKEKELLHFKDIIENIDKDRENYKNDAEIYKKNSEKFKQDLIELIEQLKKLKEEHESEKKTWGEKWLVNEKKVDTEKRSLQEQIINLQNKLTVIESHKLNSKQPINKQESIVVPSLKDVLFDNDEDDDTHLNEVLALKNEIILLKQEIEELHKKISHHLKASSEIESLKKENLKLHNDIKEITEMYESQVNDLQQKAVLVNAELLTSRRISHRRSHNEKLSVTNADQDFTMIRLNAENKFLNEKIDILSKEINQIQELNEKNINFLKQELTLTEQTAINAKVAVATLAYDKDCEIIKHKNAYRKLKKMVQVAMVGNNLNKKK